MSSLFWLVFGLVLFLGGHLVSRFPTVRAGLSGYFGESVFRAVYSIWALMGLAMIVHGYGVYRMAGYLPVWSPPRFFGHIAILLIWPAFILLIATYARGMISARAKHPMLLSVKLWATGHLLANGDLGSMLLFGSFLAWAVFARIALKKAGKMGNPADALRPDAKRNDLIALGLGTVLAFAFMFWLHRPLIGVGIFGN